MTTECASLRRFRDRSEACRGQDLGSPDPRRSEGRSFGPLRSEGSPSPDDRCETPDRPGSDIEAAIDEGILATNTAVPSYMKVQRRIVTQTAPSVDNGMLTRNLKFDRKGIYKHFQSEIEQQEAVLS